MDFSKFRESGELSDIIVVVDGQENKLHKFPLYARSDYFCNKETSKYGSRHDNDILKLDLENFPGGNETFGKVADFCYNMRLVLDKKNVVSIGCASHYLQMRGPGNLIEITNKFIQDTLSATRLNRSSSAVLAFLMNCNELGEIAKDCGIVDICIEALVDCLSNVMNKYFPTSTSSSSFSKVMPKIEHGEMNDSSSAFTTVLANTTRSTHNTLEMLDELTKDCLMKLRSEWFATILCKIKDRGVAVTKLGMLAVRYVSAAIERQSNPMATESNGISSVVDCEIERNESTEDGMDDDNDLEKDQDTATTGIANIHNSTSKVFVVHENLETILDNVILSLPEHAYSIPSVTMEWLTKVLRISTSKGCQCRAHLVRVAGEMLTRLGPEDLCLISPSVLHDIVQDANCAAETHTNDTPSNTDKSPGTTAIQSERACKLVDTYLGQMANKGVLTAETFRLLASATKDYPRPSHDPLYTVLEFVIDAEKDNLSPSQREEITNIVNFDLVNEENLQKALDMGVVPPSQLANSAIKLCSKLRSELASVKYIAEMQEQDLQKYQTASTDSARHSKPPSPPLIKDGGQFRGSYSARNTADYTDILDTGPTKSLPTSTFLDHDLEQEVITHPEDVYREKSPDALRAAQNVLTTARHKLALPVYTGYRPSHLSRPFSPSNHSLYSTRPTAVEHDISLEEELEFKFDRSFRSLDPRVRQHHHRMTSFRDNQHSSSHLGHHHQHHGSPNRSYFPYYSSSYRY